MKITRKNQALTAEVEKKVLDYLAERLYRYTTADHLSSLALVGAAISAVSYLLAADRFYFLWLANFGLFLHWFGDSLDGRTARLRDENRPKYGHYLDHVLDSISFSMIAFGVILSGLSYPLIWVIVIVLYLLLAVHTFLKASITGVFEMSFGRLGPTEFRLVVILANTLIFFTTNRILVRDPMALNVADLIGLMIIVLELSAYSQAIASTLWGKNRIREDE